MSLVHLFPKVEPDYGQLQRVFRREVPDRVPVIELFADHGFIQAVLGYTADDVASDKKLEDWQRYWLWRITFQKLTAPDFLNVGMPWLSFPRMNITTAANTAALSEGDRSWVNEAEGPIKTYEDFEQYPWPQDDVAEHTARLFDFLAEHVPEGMGILATSSGIFEWTMWLIGYERLCLALYDDPAFVRKVADRVGQRYIDGYRAAAEHPAVRALWLGDDMGYKTATMISPDHLRDYFLPWQKRIAEIAHAHGKPYLLHSCGQLQAIMDDLIDDVGIDAKHSFEDVIVPVEQFKRQYGDRIAVLGGIDVDFLARRSPSEVCARTREVLEACAPDGGYALGTGNSVTNYIPVENYAAMLQELAEFNAQR